MDRITVKDYRCFHDEQTARLAPLTLLVGENSTGKTSFLAMIRALWEIAYRHTVPDFKEAPYDLGSFDEIAHHRGGRGGRADSFQAGFRRRLGSGQDRCFSFDVTFGRTGTAPVPIKRCLASDDLSVDATQHGDVVEVAFATANGSWQRCARMDFSPRDDATLFPLLSLRLLTLHLDMDDPQPQPPDPIAVQGMREIQQLVRDVELRSRPPLFASAPVRSKPRRTYDPARPAHDPEGDYVPMYLASVYLQNKGAWDTLKSRLEKFGATAGLFDEISIKPLGSRESEPFQVQVRKFDRRLKGPHRNLIDMGYGVSQVLPVITELLRLDAPSIFLLQQPEVHLHPSAQASLGSLFCEAAADDGRLVVVETHSDHMVNRIRMDVRDGAVPLKPEDVSILYFERDALDVRIHSLRLDQKGNVLGAPPSYGRFFMAEMERSLRL